MEQRQTTMSTRSAITSEVELVAKEQNKRLAPLSDELVLLDLRASISSCFAILVARLEQRLGSIPSARLKMCTFP